MKKYWKFLIENRFQKFDRKIFEDFWKFSKKSRFSKIFEKSENFQLKSSYENFRIFRFFENLDFFEIFEKFSKKIRSRFQNLFSIKNFQYFSMNFFLNSCRMIWKSQKWRLEVARTQRGCVSERNVGEEAGVCISTNYQII